MKRYEKVELVDEVLSICIEKGMLMRVTSEMVENAEKNEKGIPEIIISEKNITAILIDFKNNSVIATTNDLGIYDLTKNINAN